MRKYNKYLQKDEVTDPISEIVYPIGMVAGAIGILGGLFIFDSPTLQTLMYSCGLGILLGQ
jgi:hypothetical protein